MIYKQLYAFILIGFLNTAFGYGVYSFFIYLEFNYILAVGLSTTIGVLFNYKTIGKIVFKSSEKGLIFKFCGVYIIVFLVNIGALYVFKEYGYNDYTAGLIALMPSAGISFTLNKFLVFKR